MNIILIPYLPTAVRANPLAEYLTKTGHKTHLILWDMPYPIEFSTLTHNFRKSFIYTKSEINGVIVHKIKRFPFFFPLINKWLFKRQIHEIYKKNNIDLIISESFFNETEPPLELPIIYDMADDHEAFPEIYGSIPYKIAYKILGVHETITNQIRCSIAVSVVSYLLYEYAKKYKKDNIYVIPNGVEDWVLKNDVQIGTPHSLVYITNYGKWSGVLNLIRAVKQLHTKYPDIILALIGDGTEIPSAKKLACQLNIEKQVKFLGRIDNRQKIYEEINKYDICLNISEKNRFRDSASPMKVFEYSALGKKVVSTELDEVKRLHFENIIFYSDNKNISNLVDAIERAFKMRIDGTEIKRKVEKYTWPNIVKEFETIYYNTVKGNMK